MNLDVDLQGVKHIEFGVGLDEKNGRACRIVTVGSAAQVALHEMAVETWSRLESADADNRFDPAERYESQDPVDLPRADTLAANLSVLHEAENLPIDSDALSDPSSVFCYSRE